MFTRKNLLIALLVTTLSACSFGTGVEQFEEPRFSAMEPLKLKVNKIEIENEFVPTFKRPNVEHLFPVSIEKTAKLWAKDRLQATDYSSKKSAVVTIKDASVTEELIKGENIFTPDNLKYKAILNVSVKISDTDNLSNAETEIQTWRELIIPAKTGLPEKEKYWNGMVVKLFDEFNTQMEKNIRQYLAIYLENEKIEATYY